VHHDKPPDCRGGGDASTRLRRRAVVGTCTKTLFVGFDPSTIDGTVEGIVVVQPETDNSLRHPVTGDAYRRVTVEQARELSVRAP